MILVLATALLVLVPTTAHAVDEPATDDVVEVVEASEEGTIDLLPEEAPVEELPDVPDSEEDATDELPAVDETNEPSVASDEPEALLAAPEEEMTNEPLEEEGEVVDFIEPRSMGTDEVIWLDGDFAGCFQQYDMVICLEQLAAEEPAAQVVEAVNPADFTPAPALSAPPAQPAMLAETGAAELSQALLAIVGALALFGGLTLLANKRRLRKQKTD